MAAARPTSTSVQRRRTVSVSCARRMARRPGCSPRPGWPRRRAARGGGRGTGTRGPPAADKLGQQLRRHGGARRIGRARGVDVERQGERHFLHGRERVADVARLQVAPDGRAELRHDGGREDVTRPRVLPRRTDGTASCSWCACDLFGRGGVGDAGDSRRQRRPKRNVCPRALAELPQRERLGVDVLGDDPGGCAAHAGRKGQQHQQQPCESYRSAHDLHYRPPRRERCLARFRARFGRLRAECAMVRGVGRTRPQAVASPVTIVGGRRSAAGYLLSKAAGGLVKLLVQPDDGAAPLLAAIRHARKSVDIMVFRFDRADIRRALAEAVNAAWPYAP